MEAFAWEHGVMVGVAVVVAAFYGEISIDVGDGVRKIKRMRAYTRYRYDLISFGLPEILL